MSTSTPKLAKGEAPARLTPTSKEIPFSDARVRDPSVDYLRAFIVLLVLLHHSVLAYATFWSAQPRIFTVTPAPVVDPQRWGGFDLLVLFNDTFFMALLFLLSGLFVWPSLERKGGARFLHDRILRLGLPFAVAVGLLMPLAYFPSYAATGADPGFLAYARAWLSLGFWPSGPAWFIWLLLVFDAVVAGTYVLRRRRNAKARTGGNFGVYGRPTAFVATLIVVSALVYIPMELAFGAERWLTLGPFSFQASRLLLYAAYFLIGLRIGASGTELGFLARRWPAWAAAGLAAYALRVAVLITLVLPVADAHRPLPLTFRLLSGLTFVLCCGTISFAFLAFFRRFVVAHHPAFDSLSVSSYGMYLIHYPIVVWLQYALLTVALSPIAKGTIVFVAAVGFSWGTVVALRRVPVVTRVL
ncbi:MAG: acyltransferase [Hyphomicrobiales bacterium]|nr:acyltransferase [Hyphomicrobiales bacterium]MBV9429654.1 acyltransferase [Bradyrhizobiaceae bacterium]